MSNDHNNEVQNTNDLRCLVGSIVFHMGSIFTINDAVEAVNHQLEDSMLYSNNIDLIRKYVDDALEFCKQHKLVAYKSGKYYLKDPVTGQFPDEYWNR